MASKELTGLRVQKSEEELNGATEKKGVTVPEFGEECALIVVFAGLEQANKGVRSEKAGAEEERNRQ